jgi:hypothetical protein
MLMTFLIDTATTSGPAPIPWKAALRGILQGGLRTCVRLRDVLGWQDSSRHPVLRLAPRRAVRRSPCGRWFVIAPIEPAGQEPFQARHATGMGTLNMNRHKD